MYVQSVVNIHPSIILLIFNCAVSGYQFSRLLHRCVCMQPSSVCEYIHPSNLLIFKHQLHVHSNSSAVDIQPLFVHSNNNSVNVRSVDVQPSIQLQVNSTNSSVIFIHQFSCYSTTIEETFICQMRGHATTNWVYIPLSFERRFNHRIRGHSTTK